MPKVARKLLSPAEYSRHRGCSRAAVTKAVRQGRITLTPEGLIDPVVADAQWLANSRPRVRSTPAAAAEPLPAGDDAPISYNEARRRQAVADALRAEDEMNERRGLLISTAAVERALGARLIASREIAMNLPARVAPLLAAESSEAAIVRILHEEIRLMLTEMAAGADDLARYRAERQGADQ